MDDRHFRADSRPPQTRKLKKKIGSLWKSIGKALAEDKAPAEDDGTEILRACSDYALFTEKKWQADWQRCVDSVENALALAKNGDYAGARQAAANANSLTRSCHKKHK